VIKARLSGSDHDILLIGLSHENLARLVADEPINFNASELGFSALDILIMAGKDEDEISAQIQKAARGPS
jgi:hypothetical protein